mgnify:CR=1 FL=1
MFYSLFSCVSTGIFYGINAGGGLLHSLFSFYIGTYYKTYGAKDRQGRTWKATYDSSIIAQKKSGGRTVGANDTYKCEIVSPILAGIISTGGGLGSVLSPLFLGMIMNGAGLRVGFGVLGFFSLAGMLICGGYYRTMEKRQDRSYGRLTPRGTRR